MPNPRLRHTTQLLAEFAFAARDNGRPVTLIVPPAAHAPQGPQAASQHTPSAQKPLRHSLSAPQGAARIFWLSW